MKAGRADHLLIRGHAGRIPLADGSVHAVVTSPPYFGLRSYLPTNDPRKALEMGLEPDPASYVAAMVAVFREVWRVLRDDGVVFLNIGDSYAGGGGGNYGTGKSVRSQGGQQITNVRNRSTWLDSTGFKPKDRLGIPHRLVFALQEDGWYWRDEIVWAKPNCLPESVKDRTTKSHEFVFVLAKRERYFWDAEAVAERPTQKPQRRLSINRNLAPDRGKGDYGLRGGCLRDHVGVDCPESGRNARSVLSIPTSPFKGSHYAVMPMRLASFCVRAGTSRRGCCPKCGKAWRRVVERTGAENHRSRDWAGEPDGMSPSGIRSLNGQTYRPVRFGTDRWRPSCSCPSAPPVPCVVFDPFCGAGTTPLVATALGRYGIGLDLSPKYLRMAARRIARPHAPAPKDHKPDDEHPLFAGVRDDDGAPP